MRKRLCDLLKQFRFKYNVATALTKMDGDGVYNTGFAYSPDRYFGFYFEKGKDVNFGSHERVQICVPEDSGVDSTHGLVFIDKQGNLSLTNSSTHTLDVQPYDNTLKRIGMGESIVLFKRDLSPQQLTDELYLCCAVQAVIGLGDFVEDKGSEDRVTREPSKVRGVPKIRKHQIVISVELKP